MSSPGPTANAPIEFFADGWFRVRGSRGVNLLVVVTGMAVCAAAFVLAYECSLAPWPEAIAEAIRRGEMCRRRQGATWLILIAVPLVMPFIAWFGWCVIRKGTPIVTFDANGIGFGAWRRAPVPWSRVQSMAWLGRINTKRFAILAFKVRHPGDPRARRASRRVAHMRTVWVSIPFGSVPARYVAHLIAEKLPHLATPLGAFDPLDHDLLWRPAVVAQRWAVAHGAMAGSNALECARKAGRDGDPKRRLAWLDIARRLGATP